MKILIINSGVSNASSVKNMLKWIGFESQIVTSLEGLGNGDKIILPGIGNFGEAMNNLEQLNLINQIKDCVSNKKIHFLGICLGMQLLMDSSEEAPESIGLGLIKGTVKKFKFIEKDNHLKIPHVGWNKIHKNYNSRIFLNHNSNQSRFYFVHSYYVECEDKKDILANTHYGNKFHSMICRDNIYGFQFHPEKSLKHGANLLRNFCTLK